MAEPTGPYTVIRLSAMRRAIAARMTQAKQTIPHFRLVGDVNVERLLARREQLNAAGAFRVSINDCLVKLCANALMKHPAVNCQLVDDHLHQYHQADISVVTAVEGGLTTPVIRNADAKHLTEIAQEMRTLAARAARSELKMPEIMGGSFTISNLGAYGVEQFDAIINPPQCAILAVGSVMPRGMVIDGRSTQVPSIRLTLSVDHRAIDGVTAARFLATLREEIERPDGIFDAADGAGEKSDDRARRPRTDASNDSLAMAASSRA
jgi:pyruvate dehydrogenase E2 component (dihydrolipoamide acetyltransferase)